MDLGSSSFVLFLIGVVAASLIVPARARWATLLVASYAFYAIVSPRFLVLLAALTLFSFQAARVIARLQDSETRALRALVVALFAVLAPLATLKYTGFVAELLGAFIPALASASESGALRFALPAGVSFFTLQVAGYLIDVHRGMVEPEQHLGRYALYVALFPRIMAGPIGRSDELGQLAELEHKGGFDYDRFTSGIKQAAWGMFKKVVVADRLAIAVDSAFANPEACSGIALVLVAVFYMFQVYADFSGYSDIAIGSARILGVELRKNFNQPYLSTSVGDYWRRWHLSFSTWLNEYVYLTIASALRSFGKKAAIVALLATFFLSGLWHGAAATFVVFGMIHGLVLVLELLTASQRKRAESSFPRATKLVARVATLGFLCTVDVLFRAPSLGVAGTFYRAAGVGIVHDAQLLAARGLKIDTLRPLLAGLGLGSTELVLAVACVALLVVVDLLAEREPISVRLSRRSRWIKWCVYYAVAIGIVFFGAHNHSTSFVYYQF